MMKRLWLVITGILIIVFIVAQFFQPERNSAAITTNDFLYEAQGTPSDIGKMMQNSCYDCHSDSTAYPWYGRIAPASWMLGNHIKEARAELNFSAWGTLSDRKRISALQDICEVITEGTMPLKSYTLLHHKARLSKSQTERICSWAKEESQLILDGQD